MPADRPERGSRFRRLLRHISAAHDQLHVAGKQFEDIYMRLA